MTLESWLSRTRVSEHSICGNEFTEQQRLMRWLYYFSGDAESEDRKRLHADYCINQINKSYDT